MFNQTNLKFREMKKSIFMFALATLMSASVFAQDNDAKRLPGYKTTFEGNGFWNNWFMSANFGAQSLFAENSKDAKFRNTITFMPTLSVGKWFNPYWGVRLQGTGGSLHGFTSGANSMLHYQYGAVHADFMFGLINFFAPYKENGLLDFVVGLDYGHDYTLTFNREWDKIFNDYMNKEY